MYKVNFVCMSSSSAPCFKLKPHKPYIFYGSAYTVAQIVAWLSSQDLCWSSNRWKKVFTRQRDQETDGGRSGHIPVAGFACPMVVRIIHDSVTRHSEECLVTWLGAGLPRIRIFHHLWRNNEPLISFL